MHMIDGLYVNTMSSNKRKAVRILNGMWFVVTSLLIITVVYPPPVYANQKYFEPDEFRSIVCLFYRTMKCAARHYSKLAFNVHGERPQYSFTFSEHVAINTWKHYAIHTDTHFPAIHRLYSYIVFSSECVCIGVDKCNVHMSKHGKRSTGLRVDQVSCVCRTQCTLNVAFNLLKVPSTIQWFVA